MLLHNLILALIHLLLGYVLPLFFVLGHIAFLNEWSSGGFSIISEPLSFARFYQDFSPTEVILSVGL